MSIVRTAETGRYGGLVMAGVHGDVTCPCCGYKTLAEREGYDICPICFWEDEPVNVPYVPMGGANGSLSLYEAHHNFIAFGASERASLPFVRRVAVSEH